jgi:hypothetical protein
MSPREVLTHPHPVVLSIRVSTLYYKVVISIEETLQVDFDEEFQKALTDGKFPTFWLSKFAVLERPCRCARRNSCRHSLDMGPKIISARTPSHASRIPGRNL